MSQTLFRLAIILATLSSYTRASMFNGPPKFILKAENNKAFDNSSLVKTFDIQSDNIAECLQQCLQDCRCQSFQICQNTKCQLCSSHKEENSSLLHDEDGCVYATYEIRQSTKKFQKLEEQCLDTSCALKYYCCQQAGVCPENKTCKPFNSSTKPWKRFTCECRDGYHGDNCDKPITSCQGYASSFQKSGVYKLAGYHAYCHFESGSAWTLVQSYSFANSSLEQLKKPLSTDQPLNENDPTWSGYRLGRSRMRSIKDDSTFLLFTCDYEKNNLRPKASDYLQISIQNINIEFTQYGNIYNILINSGHGKIDESDLTDCTIELVQGWSVPFHVHIVYGNQCGFNNNCRGSNNDYFGSFSSSRNCSINHRCKQNNNSTTQLWFGTQKVDATQVRRGSTRNPVGPVHASENTGH